MSEQKSADLLVEKAKSIAAVIRAHAAEAEQQRRLSRPVVDAMLEAGLYGLTRPKSFGGLETDPVTLFRVVEEIARNDSAAGWNLQTLACGGSISGLAGKRRRVGDSEQPSRNRPRRLVLA